ncbi:methyltransferase domain-containing protein [Massilia sp. PAMC28688]|uniref:class I SAM-dependent methyltransferase n=1 Tax=Massilia sp. PAMC28688 TaxID=2861283 RepID=UPI001C62C316|nr:class I SAM-dependent methyltransferase [Massilia sp. PAMC28688]QYF94923.1 methyltransferase domain-containing protein [Massilia sp. PAMC28688]
MSQLSPEMDALKARLKATWMSGDYAHFAQYLLPGALEFLDRLKLLPGTRMLDVGCGAGQIAIPAAQAGVDVTGVDIASNLIEHARRRAATDNVRARFEEGDAEMLPFPDASFDVVVSLIGAMFAPRPELVARELIRVCRPGGRIHMANWTPEGHVGQMFKIIGKHVPAPPLMVSPIKWGDEATVRDRLSSGTLHVETVKRTYPMHYPFPPEEVTDFFFEFYGPTVRAKAALDEAAFAALRDELAGLWRENNRATDGGTHVNAEYLEVSATRAETV